MASEDWKFAQVFGDKSPIEEVTDVDIVSAIEFNEDGEFVAAGDRGGRVVLFEASKDTKKGQLPEYKFYCEFQSHEPEFDYLKSLEIEEKINKIKWLKRPNNAHFLLTTNDKTIKLWKVFEKGVPTATAPPPATKGKLHVPTVTAKETVVTAVPRKIYSNAHTYHINSISLNSDGETYISSDDLRINLWNLGINEESFNIVDIKPANMEELTEVITSAEFHPSHCNLFMYSSSKGTIKLGDMRSSALCDQHAKVFEEEEDPANKSFFSEIISSISDIKFSSDGRFILSRDYLTLKIWDIRQEGRPLKVLPIHDHLRAKLCDLYENDSIFDKFECCFSGDGKHCLTGSYHNTFHCFDHEGNTVSIEANKNKRSQPATRTPRGRQRAINPDTIDFTRKILHVAWHPRDSFVAIAANNNLFTYGVAAQ